MDGSMAMGSVLFHHVAHSNSWWHGDLFVEIVDVGLVEPDDLSTESNVDFTVEVSFLR